MELDEYLPEYLTEKTKEEQTGNDKQKYFPNAIWIKLNFIMLIVGKQLVYPSTDSNADSIASNNTYLNIVEILFQLKKI